VWIDDDVICRNDDISEPEIYLDQNVSLCLEAGSDDVIPEPEVVVHPVENPSPILVSSDYSSAVDEGARQYLYDDVEGHYSPAGRGYPHGFPHASTAVPRVHFQVARRSPDDHDHVIPGLSVL